MIIKQETKRVLGWLFILFDLIVINLSFAAGWWIRFESGWLPLDKPYQPYNAYFDPGLLVSLIWVLVFAYLKVYQVNILDPVKKDILRLIKGSFFAAFITMALSFIYRGYSYSRLTFGLGVILIIIVLIFSHWAFKAVIKGLVRKGFWISRTIIIGSGETARMLLNHYLREPLMMPGLVGFLTVGSAPHRIPTRFIRGDLGDLKRVLIQNNIDQLILADTHLPEEKIIWIIYECRKENVLFEMVPMFHNLMRGNVHSVTMGSLTMLSFPDIALKGWQRVAKRLFDLILSVCFLVLCLPLIIIIALVIKLTTTGPVFFKQKRVGRNGRIFDMLKFRTMCLKAEELQECLHPLNESDGPFFKIRCDPRITRPGRFLRRFSLDELPQLFNVAKGEMSLVGPRPPLLSELREYRKWHLKRIDTIPGLTGLWQVSGRSDLPFDTMAKLDLYYINNWSLWMDLTILVRTIPAIISGKGAY
ncbi:sugar transferase [bacterium]|nr:sugar transferase [bacterium]